MREAQQSYFPGPDSKTCGSLLVLLGLAQSEPKSVCANIIMAPAHIALLLILIPLTSGSLPANLGGPSSFAPGQPSPSFSVALLDGTTMA